ncbi:MAG: sulfatase-like hydrolase/transferase [Planctomycetaceae bacterium]|nr:sulfatase-like hydrolase/transferase [Planctomycetaceae bacterium]
MRLLLFVLLVLLYFHPIGSAQELPNVVFLLADDLGGSDLHCYGHPYSRTPNIDRLAAEGTRFTQFYATGATCCPTRTGLMTSWFPARFSTYPANGGFADRVTITELLRKRGYATGHFGKWHIGPDTKAGTYGIDVINSVDDQTVKNRKSKDERGRDAHIYDDAIRFIEQHQGGPFYVNVWGHISHNPVNPVDSLVKRWKGLSVKESDFPEPMHSKFIAVRDGGGDVNDAMSRYLADVESLDDAVGRLLKRLDELNLRNKTIVVFSTDQGADMTKAGQGGLRFNQMGNNGALRGGKHTHWEGGVRVPWIVRWPGHVPAGQVDEQSVLSGADWLPTLCSITGTEINQSDFDGEDTSAAWLGKNRHVRSKPLLWKTSSAGSEAFIREAQWKLRRPTRRKDGELELYDLIADPNESRNVAADHPEIARQLDAKLAQWVSTLPKDYLKAKDNED